MKKALFRNILVAVVAAVGLASCSESNEATGEKEIFVPTVHIVKGKVEKGPLVRGSQIDMRTLDQNTGDFNFGSLKVNTPYAKLTADGYFFNEVDGKLSTSTIKLDAIVDLSDNSTVNVNVLTHLKSKRINHLIANEGKTFKEANEQAQRELLAQFGLQGYATKDASKFSITSGDDAAGALIAVSSLILSDRSEAEIVEYLSLLSNEFSTIGTFSDTTKKKLKSTRNYLNGRLDKIATNIKERYKELGYEVGVKDLASFFDWDNDGIAGNELDESSTVQLSQNQISVPAEGGDFTVKIESEKPYFLDPPSEITGSDTGLDQYPSESVSPEHFFSNLYEEGANTNVPESEKVTSIENNVIKIHVGATLSRKPESWSIKIYNARGVIAAEIAMTQSGNQNIKINTPKLGSAGIQAVSNFLLYMRDAIKTERYLEGKYVQNPHKPFSSNDNSIANCWNYYYKSISQLVEIKKYDKNELDCYQPFLNTYIALNYYMLSSHWGKLPFYTEPLASVVDRPAPMSEGDILAALSNLLEEAIPYLEEKKNDAFTDANSAFFVSKDVARVLLAYVRCNQKKFDSALPLLEKVIGNGYYSLIQSAPVNYKKDSECILGFEMGTRAGSNENEQCYPCLDYKDVILTAAECLYHTGNTTKAKEYIQMVCKTKSLSVDDSDILKAIATLRYKLQTPNYLTFIRRNGLGQSYMGLGANETYQLLWPIPQWEMDMNPTITQNPGYW